MDDRLIRMPEVIAITGLTRRTIYRLMAMDPPDFPERVQLGKSCIAWVSHEVTDWVNDRMAKRRGGIARPFQQSQSDAAPHAATPTHRRHEADARVPTATAGSPDDADAIVVRLPDDRGRWIEVRVMVSRYGFDGRNQQWRRQ